MDASVWAVECWPMAKVQVMKITYTKLCRTCQISHCPNMSETTLHKKCRLKAQRYTFAGKPVVSNMSDSLFLTRYYITKQSLVFLFNIGLEVYFRIVGQQ